MTVSVAKWWCTSRREAGTYTGHGESWRCWLFLGGQRRWLGLDGKMSRLFADVRRFLVLPNLTATTTFTGSTGPATPLLQPAVLIHSVVGNNSPNSWKRKDCCGQGGLL